MTCDESREQLSDYLDLRLADRERLLLEEHLEECPACQAEFQDMKNLRSLLGNTPEQSPPESFYEAVHARIDTLPDPKPSFNWGAWPKTLASACVLLVVVMATRGIWHTEPQPFKESPLKIPAPSSAQKDTRETGELDDLIHQLESQPGLGHSATSAPTPPAAPSIAMTPPAPAAPSPRMAVASLSASAPAPRSTEALSYEEGLKAKAVVPTGGNENVTPVAVQTLVIRNQDSWRTIWALRQAADATSSAAAPVPVVDFDQYTVVTVLDGRVPPDDLSIDLVNVQTLSDRIEVQYRVTPSVTETGPANTAAPPFHFNVIAKTSLPITFRQVP